MLTPCADGASVDVLSGDAGSDELYGYDDDDNLWEAQVQITWYGGARQRRARTGGRQAQTPWTAETATTR